MVTTRRRGEKPANDNLDEDDTINVYVPRTPKRKLDKISKLQDEEEEAFYTPPTSKRARVGKEITSTPQPNEESPAASRLVVEIPAMVPPPAAEIADLEGVGESKKIKKPLPVRTRNGGSKLAAVVTLDPEEAAVEEVISGDMNGVDDGDVMENAEEDLKDDSGDDLEENKVEDKVEDKWGNNAQNPATENASIPDPPTVPYESLRPTTFDRKLSDHSKSQTTDTLVPLSIRGSTLPDLLPAEFLQDEEETPSTTGLEVKVPKLEGKKTKFADEVNPKPMDRRIGTTTYRVAKPRAIELAPKASAHARSLKDEWMQGRSGKKGISNRKPFSSGFFVKR